MAVCSTTALRKYLTQRSNLGQPLREKAASTTRGHAERETIRNSGRYRRPLFKSSQAAAFDFGLHAVGVSVYRFDNSHLVRVKIFPPDGTASYGKARSAAPDPARTAPRGCAAAEGRKVARAGRSG